MMTTTKIYFQTKLMDSIHEMIDDDQMTRKFMPLRKSLIALFNLLMGIGFPSV